MNPERWRQQRRQTAVRHITKYRQLAEAHEGADGMPVLQAEHDNLQTAVAHAIRQQQADELQRLTWVLGRPFDGYMSRSGHWSELANLLQESVALSEAQNDLEIAAAFRADLATVQMWQGKMAAARENYRAALAILKTAEPAPAIQTAIAAIYHHLGNLAQQAADYRAARHHYQKALFLQRALNNRSGIAKTLHQLGSLAAASGNLEEARPFYEESLAISKALSDHGQIALTAWNLGNLAYRQGQLATAEQNYYQALALFEALDDQRNKAGVLHTLGQIALDRGDVAAARHYAEESLTIKNQFGYRITQPTTLGLLGIITYAEDDGATAESLFQQAIALATDMGAWQELNNQRFNLAMLYQLQERLGEAVQLLQSVVATAEQFGLPTLEEEREALARIQEKAARPRASAGEADRDSS